MNQMNKIKIIPDFLMLFIGVGGLIFFIATYLITGVANHTLLAFSLVCSFYGLIIIFILGITLKSKYSETVMEQDKYE